MTEKVSNTPWSQFSPSDYTDQQYAKACLLDRGASVTAAKQRYGLPVREPSGVVNSNAVSAAAAVLSSKGGTGSARGNKLIATTEQIAAARKKLVAIYKNVLKKDPPDGLASVAHSMTAEDILMHHGIKGMKWGVRRSKEELSANPIPVSIESNVHGQVRRANGGQNQPASEDAIKTHTSRQTAKASGTDALSTKDLQELVNRMNLEQQYSRLSSQKSTVDRGHESVKKILSIAKTGADVYNFVNSPGGKALRKVLS